MGIDSGYRIGLVASILASQTNHYGLLGPSLVSGYTHPVPRKPYGIVKAQRAAKKLKNKRNK